MPGSDLVVVWRASTHCNMNCGFCGYARSLNRAREHGQWPVVESGLHALARATQPLARRVMISWLGGEPLLWPPLAQATALARALGFATSITTNGSLLTKGRWVDFCTTMLDEITLSVDGLAAFHDAVRDETGSWMALRRACRALRMRNATLRIRINTILMHGNIGRFAELCEAVADWGANEVSFNALGGNDRPGFFPDNRILPDQWSVFAATLPALRTLLASRGLTISGDDRYVQRIAAFVHGRAVAVADCKPGRRFIFVDENGRAAPCSYTLEPYGIPLESDAELPAQWDAARATRRAKACDDCLCTNVFGKFDHA